MKSNKKNFKYYLATIDEDINIENTFDIDLNSNDIKLKDFTKSGYRLLIDYFDGFTFYTEDIKDDNVMKSSKLGKLIHTFLFNFDPSDYLEDSDDDEDISEVVADVLHDRISTLLDELYVIRYDKKNKTLNVVKEDLIINILDDIFQKNKQKPVLDEKSDEVCESFNDLMTKCIGDNENAILTFSNLNTGSTEIVYDVKNNNNTFFYGYNQKDNDEFPYLLTHFSKGYGSIIVRVFTKQYVNDLPVKELFGFVCKNGEFSNVDTHTLNDACNTDNRTGNKIKPEENVVYCDLNGNRICSEDI